MEDEILRLWAQNDTSKGYGVLAISPCRITQNDRLLSCSLLSILPKTHYSGVRGIGLEREIPLDDSRLSPQALGVILLTQVIESSCRALPFLELCRKNLAHLRPGEP